MRSLCLNTMLLLTLVMTASGFAQQQNASNALQEDLKAKLSVDLNRAAASYDGAMGIFVKDLTNGDTFAINADTVFPQASSIKIPILIELMHQAEAGKLNLADRVEIHPANLVGGSGVLQFFSEGGSAVSLRDWLF